MELVFFRRKGLREQALSRQVPLARPLREEASMIHVCRAILVEHFRRMAQINRQFARDYPEKFVIDLIFDNRKSRFLVDAHKHT